MGHARWLVALLAVDFLIYRPWLRAPLRTFLGIELARP